MQKLRYIIYLGRVLLIISIMLSWNCSSLDKNQNKIQASPSPTSSENEIPTQHKQEEKTQISDENKNQENVEFLSQEKTLIQEKNDEEKEDPLEILEEALDAQQDARQAWEKGDFDTALVALDEAYSLILKVNLPPDSPFIQEKNDLRLLIAQRIQEIYASRLTTVGDNHQTIPLIENKDVKEEIKIFQTKERKYFLESYKRSGTYKSMILEELKKAGLPEELSWVPIIESWFKNRALSRARALGLWQFISSTGYRYGLKRDRWVDERMDPIKSTRAAIKYLNDLHSFFGDWTTALAAYNCGEFKVQKVIRTQRPKYLDNFWDLYRMLPRETARHVPRFIAAVLIINNPEKYGFNLPELDPSLEFETISINRPVQLSSLSKALGLKADELTSLNPELRQNASPDYEYDLRVPVGYGEKTIAAFNSLPRWVHPEDTFITHYVRRGETLSGIAQRYRTSISAIARLNNLRRVHLIRPRQRLKIPMRGARYSSYIPPKLIREGEKPIYIVRRGDSLYRIARAFDTTVEKIKKDNSLKSDILSVGQKLIIQSGKPEGTATYIVKAGDSPFEIARKFGMSLNTLLRLNGLTLRSKIYPGQELWIVPQKESKY